MDRRRRPIKKIKVLIILAVIISFVIGIIIIKHDKPDGPEITEEKVSYTTFLQLINENRISSIVMEENSTVISGFNQKNPNYIYKSKAPNIEILTGYLQEKSLNGDEISFTVKEKEKEKDFFSIISFVLMCILILWPILMVFAMFKSLKKMFKDNIEEPPMLGELLGNGTGSFEKATKSSVTFKDVKGLDEEIRELSEIVDFIKNPDKYKNLGAKIPKGILLDGAPGTGKTLLAKAVAGEADISFIATSGSHFVEMFVGLGASRIRSLFKEARKNAPCIIFIDEIDAVGAKRDEHSGSSEHNQTLEQLLAEMDGFTERTGIVVMAATNRLSSLDPALIRPGRFDRKITIHLPDRKGREEILNHHGSDKPFDENVDFSSVAYNTAGFSGAELENLLNEAALIAARNSHSSISNEDITEAMMKIQVGLKKANRIISEKERRMTAVHEAGHAVVSLFTETKASLKEVCIIARGSAGGYTLHDTVEDKNYATKKELTERLVVLMGGKAAESIVLGDISTGPSNDLKVATEIAREMVIYYGMDDEVGPISFEGISNSDLEIWGNKTLGNVGTKISELVKKAEKEAIDIINKNRSLLDTIVERLLEKETVSGEEIEEIYRKYSSIK